MMGPAEKRTRAKYWIEGVPMDASQFFILLSIAALAVIAVLFVVLARNKGGSKGSRLSPLAGLAFGFILAGLFFNENRLLGYSLLGIGVVLAVGDMIRQRRHA
jgi:hypothetical protein